MRQDESRLLKALYEDYLVPLKKFAAKLGVNSADIEDIVHETFLNYYERYPLDWSDRQKAVMLIRILRSRWIDYNRKNSHYADVSVDNPTDEFMFLGKLLDKDTLVCVMDNEMYREIWKLIADMKKDWRDVLVLRVLEELSTQETCEILGIPGTVCRSRLTRARKELRERIQKAGLFDD